MRPAIAPVVPLYALLAVILASPPARAGEVVPLASELVVDGLEEPVFVTAPLGDPRLFILEQSNGRVRVFRNGQLKPQPFLDLGGQLSGGGENGLLGLAFAPDYATSGRVYVFYNGLDGDTRLVRYLRDPSDPGKVDPASAEELLVLGQPFPQHNGGMLAFQPFDGMLYLSTGDGGNANDPLDNAHNLASPLGKMLRLDVSVPRGYAIPPDNPFVGTPGARGEIWHYGLRNPWRFSFDRVSGDLYIGDVGQEAREEIDVVPLGGPAAIDFGWRCKEGSTCNPVWPHCGCQAPAFLDPLVEYDHDKGCAVIGGYVYRGLAMPALHGTYFYGDYCSGRVWSFRVEGGQVVEHLERTTELSPPGGDLGFITSFGEGGDGELYIVAGVPGTLRRIVPAPKGADCDGDGTPDEEEIAAGTAFDVNRNGTPDDCELELTVAPLLAGSTSTLTFLGLQPGMAAAFFATTRGIGQGPCFFDGAVCLDLGLMNLGGEFGVLLLGLAMADAQGVASLPLFVPAGLSGVQQVTFQAISLDGPDSVKSNVDQKVYQG